ncbi:MAG: hypothetical protein ACLTYN_02300 [Dysosmobacter welbionis]
MGRTAGRSCLLPAGDADVILSKLDNVDDAKRLRYRYVYAKLRTLRTISSPLGWTPPSAPPAPPPGQKCCPAEHGRGGDRSAAYRRGPNIRLMHRLGASSSSATLWRPPGAKEPARLQAYVSIF